MLKLLNSYVLAGVANSSWLPLPFDFQDRLLHSQRTSSASDFFFPRT